jgi:hypothetical protein
VTRPAFAKAMADKIGSTLRPRSVQARSLQVDSTSSPLVGFVWVCFGWFIVRCSLLLVIVYTAVTTIFGFLEIGFVLNNLLFLIDPSSLSRGASNAARYGRFQNQPVNLILSYCFSF